MFSIWGLVKRFKGEWDELDPAYRFLIYCETCIYLLLAFVLGIWQPDFL